MLRTGRRRAALAGLCLAFAAGCTPAQRATPSDPATPAPDDAAEVSESPSARPDRGCPDCRARPRSIGRFRTALAPEASGIAAGVRNPDLLYIVDDGPGTSELLVLRAKDATVVGRLPIAGLDGVDTEGLAVGPCDGSEQSSCIYIGDIGDNLESRDSISVVRVREPDLSGGIREQPLAADTAIWRYPDRPRNAEALLAGGDGSLVIITKDPGKRGRGGARLYIAQRFGDATLRAGRRLPLPTPGLPLAAAVVGNVVTAADAAPGRVIVRTYDALYEFTTDRPGQPLQHFPSWRRREVAAPAEGQGEAVAYATDACGLFTVSEGSGRVTSIPCR